MQGIIILQIYIGLLYLHPEQSDRDFWFVYSKLIFFYIIVYYIDIQYAAS